MKPVFILAIVLAFLIYLAPRGYSQNSPTDDQKESQNQPASPSGQIHAKTKTKAPKQEPPQWYESPEWILVIVGFVTAFVIGWQSWEARKAAEASREAANAALRQANHIVTSERAWMIAEPGDVNIPPEIEGATGIRWTEFSVRFVNKGKTLAFLLEIGYRGKVLPHRESLPALQLPYEEKEIHKWSGKGLPLLPGADVYKPHLGTWANDPVKITRGYDALWVYGYIKYADAFGFARETWYCYRWVHEIERYQSSGFIAGGPESYNRAT